MLLATKRAPQSLHGRKCWLRIAIIGDQPDELDPANLVLRKGSGLYLKTLGLQYLGYHLAKIARNADRDRAVRFGSE